MKLDVERHSSIVRTPRVQQLEGMFDLPPNERSELRWTVELPIEERDWNVGLIVGPSGAGKSTIAREAWPDALSIEHSWSDDHSVIDGFPETMSIRDVVQLLSSVGFSSPPAWLRPHRVLSTGEQFRVSIARALADEREITVVDEFTSTVDRTVAQIGSCAIAKTVRARRQRFVAVTCHYDVLDWLQPDWVYQPHVDDFAWRHLQSRPHITLDVARCDSSAWRLFGAHHYLSDKLNKASAVWVGFYDEHPCVMLAMLPMPTGRARNYWRIHRVVTLPDYQGVGIGNAFCDYIAGVYRAAQRRVFITTSHPALTRSFARSATWRMHRAPSFTSTHGDTGIRGMAKSRAGASARLTAGFEYVGAAVDSTLVAAL